jgi:AAA domain
MHAGGNPNLITPEPFRFTFTQPYESFINGEPAPVPYVVDGLLIQGGLSILGGKPKQGKSSLSRYLARCVAAGRPFLGRDTDQGEVILINLEDPLNHVDICLKALGYDPTAGHGQIHITTTLSPDINETFDALVDALARHENVRLVVIDHLAKFLRVRDLSEYMPVQMGFQRLRNVARQFPHLHIQALAHSKKVQTDDPFDQILGSTALRGEPDTNMILFERNGERFMTTETRVGRAIQATQLHAELITSAGADVVSDFSLGVLLDDWQAEKHDKAERRQAEDYQGRIIAYLQSCDGETALQQQVINNVTGNTKRITDAIKLLTDTGMLKAAGSPRALTLVGGDALNLHMLARGNGTGMV